MTALPEVVIVGACVSRDPFSRRFMPDYWQKARVSETIYQSSLPSLFREEEVNVSLPETLKPNHSENIRQEFMGKNLARLATAKADVVVFDFFSDVHFGVTKMSDKYITRNHMAFQSLSCADDFFDDARLSAPERMRFLADQEKVYELLAVEAIAKVVNVFKDRTRTPLFVLNSARMSGEYVTPVGNKKFPQSERLKQKNQSWNALDEKFQSITDCARIEYPEDVFVGSDKHSWGLHPVHYTQPYYDYFWASFDKILR